MSLLGGRTLHDWSHSSADLLVSGPPLTGKTDLALSAVSTRAERSVVLTAHERPDAIVDTVRDCGGDPEMLRVVDCSGQGDPADERVAVVGTPSDLTTAGVELSDAVDRLEVVTPDDRSAPLGVTLCSLSHLLTYHDTARVCQFVDAVRDHLAAEGFVVGVLNDRMHDEGTVAAVIEQFDAVAETRVTDEGRQTRLRDDTGTPSEWQSF